MKRTPEQILHIAVADYLRFALKPPTLWTTIGHGGGGKIRGALLKAMGLRPGVADLLVIHPMARSWGAPAPVVIWLELKVDSSPSESQKAFREDSFKAGCHYRVCRSVDAVESFLHDLGVPLHAVAYRRAA